MSRKAGIALPAALVTAVAAVALLVSASVFLGTNRAVQGTEDVPRNTVPTTAQRASSGRWVGTWSASMAGTEPAPGQIRPRTSLRQVVHTSVGGTSVRIHLSNVFGDKPLTVSRATVALAAAPGTADAAKGSMRPLTFGGKRSVTIPAGKSTVSDAVVLRVPAAADLLVTSYSPDPSGAVTWHRHARQTSFAAPGDHTADLPGAAFTERTTSWRHLSAVDVWTTEAQGAVVAFGDSITDGVRSTVDANRRWTDYLARRLRETPGAPRLGVLNQGISGNRLLTDGTGPRAGNGQSGLTRMDRDVLSQTGATAVVVALGINDILRAPDGGDAEAIIEGLRAITERAHARGLRVIGATLTPFGGHSGHTPQREAVRLRVNAEIRSGTVFDAVVDFDRALADPNRPERLLPRYDSGDHLHPNDAGNKALADSIDLRSLAARATARA